MTDDNFKKILGNAIKPLQQGLDEVRGGLNEVRGGLDEVRGGLNEVRKDLKEVKETIESRVLPSLTYIETTVKSYADRYVANKDHIGRLDKRLNTVEDKLEINPPQELTIPSTD